MDFGLRMPRAWVPVDSRRRERGVILAHGPSSGERSRVLSTFCHETQLEVLVVFGAARGEVGTCRTTAFGDALAAGRRRQARRSRRIGEWGRHCG